jgi:hypothetical protein
MQGALGFAVTQFTSSLFGALLAVGDWFSKLVRSFSFWGDGWFTSKAPDMSTSMQAIASGARTALDSPGLLAIGADEGWLARIVNMIPGFGASGSSTVRAMTVMDIGYFVGLLVIDGLKLMAFKAAKSKDYSAFTKMAARKAIFVLEFARLVVDGSRLVAMFAPLAVTASAWYPVFIAALILIAMWLGADLALGYAGNAAVGVAELWKRFTQGSSQDR